MDHEELWADELDALEAAMLELLTRSPATLEDLATALHLGLTEQLKAVPFDEFTALIDDFVMGSEHIWWDARSDLIYSTAAMLQGRSFTGRVAEHRGRPALAVGPGLGLVVDSASERTLPTGEELETEYDTVHDRLWLYVPDHLAAEVAVGAVGEVLFIGGDVAIRPVDVSGVSDGQAEVDAATAVIHAAGPGNGVEIWPAMMDLVIDNPLLFTNQILPFDELLEAAGIEVRGDYMGLAGTDWKSVVEQGFEARRQSIGAYFGFEDCCEAALDQLGEQWRLWDHAHTSYTLEFGHPPTSPLQALAWSETEIDAGIVLAAAAHDMALPAFMLLNHYGVTNRRSLNAANGFDEANYPDEAALLRAYQLDGLGWQAPSASFASFVDLVTEQAVGPHPGAELLLAQMHTMSGDSREAERSLRRALRMDDDQPAALIAMMGSAIDASRFDEAIRVSDRFFGPESESTHQLRPFVGAIVTASRNEPCPCGSGRKFKQCHATSVLIDPSVRTKVLVFKLGRFADEWFRRQIMWSGGDDQGIAELAVSDPTIRDFMVFDSPLIERFIELRADLVPAEELEQLREWQDTKRRLFEITAVEPGHSLTLRDLQTDELVTVIERSGSLEARVHDHVLARCEERHGVATTFGAVVGVDETQLDDVLEILDEDHDCYDWLEWYESASVPPTITTRDGELFEPHSARLSTTASREQTVALLDARFGQADTTLAVEERTWTEVHLAGPGDVPAPDADDSVTAIDETDEELLEENWIRAQIGIDGDHVSLTTMSQARHQRFVNELLQLLPGADLVEQSHTSQAELYQMIASGDDRAAGDEQDDQI